MVMVVTDPTVFRDLGSILDEESDPRIRLFVPANLKPYQEKTSAYHETDQAIQRCAADSAWLLVTNADNHYRRDFLDDLDPAADIIGHDFYSRYHRVLDESVFGQRCMRWRDGICKPNLLKSWHTDLGANIMNLNRWRCESRQYSALRADSTQDGRMLDSLIYWGWIPKRVQSCGFSHFPNPFACKHFLGLDWDDDASKCASGDLSHSSHGVIVLSPTVNFTCWSKRNIRDISDEA